MATLITGIIEKIIDAMKTFIKNIEDLGSKVITDLEVYSGKIANEILSLMKSVFERVISTINRIFETFKTKISQLARKIKKPQFQSGTTIVSKIKNVCKECFGKMGEITKNFGSKVKAFADEIGIVLRKIGQGIERGTVKTYDEAKKIAEKTVEKLVKIGEIAVEETKNTVEKFSKDFEIAGEFVYKHGVEIAAVSSISVIEPAIPVVMSFGIATILIVSASMYKPGTSVN